MSGQVINAMASLGTIWTVGLSVLGIYVYKRSQDKKHGMPATDKDQNVTPFQSIIDLLLKNKA